MVAPDGDQLYVAVDPATDPTTEPRELWVFDTSGATTLAGGAVRSGPVPGSEGTTLKLCTVDDGRLVAAVANGWVHAWTTGVPDVTTIATTADLAVQLGDIDRASDGDHLYVPAAFRRRTSSRSHRLQTSIPRRSWSPASPPSTSRWCGAPGPDRLLLGEGTSLFAVDPAAATVLGSVSVAHDVVALAVREGGHFALAIVEDGASAYVQGVSLQGLLQGLPVNATTPIPVGDRGQGVALLANGQRAFRVLPRRCERRHGGRRGCDSTLARATAARGWRAATVPTTSRSASRSPWWSATKPGAICSTGWSRRQRRTRTRPRA